MLREFQERHHFSYLTFDEKLERETEQKYQPAFTALNWLSVGSIALVIWYIWYRMMFY